MARRIGELVQWEAFIFVAIVTLPSGALAKQQLALGNKFSCELLYDGQVKCWGEIGEGGTLVGDEPDEMGDFLDPIDLGAGRTALQIASLEKDVCAVLDNHDLKCWGRNSIGIGGQGHTNAIGWQPSGLGDNLPAIDLGVGKKALQVAVGFEHACAVLNDHSLKCWGESKNGELGQESKSNFGDIPGTMGDNLPSIDLGIGRTASQVAAGHRHSCALLDDGSAKCWGWGAKGQLGLQDKKSRGGSSGQMGDNLPSIDFGVGREPLSISAGYQHSCSLISSASGNSVTCWGLVNSPEPIRGDESDEMGDSLEFVDFGSTAQPVKVQAGRKSTCAVLSDGLAKCYGDNAGSKLGQPGAVNIVASEVAAVPGIDFGTGKLVEDITIGYFHTCAILVGGSTKCFGLNSYARLGSESTKNYAAVDGNLGDNLPELKLPIPSSATNGQQNEPSSATSTTPPITTTNEPSSAISATPPETTTNEPSSVTSTTPQETTTNKVSAATSTTILLSPSTFTSKISSTTGAEPEPEVELATEPEPQAYEATSPQACIPYLLEKGEECPYTDAVSDAESCERVTTTFTYSFSGVSNYAGRGNAPGCYVHYNTGRIRFNTHVGSKMNAGCCGGVCCGLPTIDDITSVPATTTPAPTTTSKVDACTQYGGICSGIGSACQICCASSCGTCGGSGCSSRPGGWAACCTSSIPDYHCSTAQLAPCTMNEATEAPTTEAPTTEAPTTDALTTEAPTTAVHTTEAPTTEAPTIPEATPETISVSDAHADEDINGVYTLQDGTFGGGPFWRKESGVVDVWLLKFSSIGVWYFTSSTRKSSGEQGGWAFSEVPSEIPTEEAGQWKTWDGSIFQGSSMLVVKYTQAPPTCTSYSLGKGQECPESDYITDAASCERVAADFTYPYDGQSVTPGRGRAPGCYMHHNTGKIKFSKHVGGAMNPGCCGGVCLHCSNVPMTTTTTTTKVFATVATTSPRAHYDCAESPWPDKKYGLVCGECKVLVTNFQLTYQTCDGYCAGLGLFCVKAFRVSGNTCAAETRIFCDSPEPSNEAICECRPEPPTTTRITTTINTCGTHSDCHPGEFCNVSTSMCEEMGTTTTTDTGIATGATTTIATDTTTESILISSTVQVVASTQVETTSIGGSISTSEMESTSTASTTWKYSQLASTAEVTTTLETTEESTTTVEATSTEEAIAILEGTTITSHDPLEKTTIAPHFTTTEDVAITTPFQTTEKLTGTTYTASITVAPATSSGQQMSGRMNCRIPSSVRATQVESVTRASLAAHFEIDEGAIDLVVQLARRLESEHSFRKLSTFWLVEFSALVPGENLAAVKEKMEDSGGHEVLASLMKEKLIAAGAIDALAKISLHDFEASMVTVLSSSTPFAMGATTTLGGGIDPSTNESLLINIAENEVSAKSQGGPRALMLLGLVIAGCSALACIGFCCACRYNKRLNGKMKDITNTHSKTSFLRMSVEKTQSSASSCGSASTQSFEARGSIGSTSDVPVLPDGKKYHFFLSHKKTHSLYGNRSESIALHLHDLLEEKGWIGFMDIDKLTTITEEDLSAHVRDSCAMIVVLSDETCDSEWCRMEWEVAASYGVPVACVIDLSLFNKPAVLAQVQSTNPYLLMHQWMEYTDKHRKEIPGECSVWLLAMMQQYSEEFCPTTSTPVHMSVSGNFKKRRNQSMDASPSVLSVGSTALPTRTSTMNSGFNYASEDTPRDALLETPRGSHQSGTRIGNSHVSFDVEEQDIVRRIGNSIVSLDPLLVEL